MKLLTKEIASHFVAAPTDRPPKVTPVVVKFFTPDANATWFVTEGEQQDNGDWLLFGFADLGDRECAELGYVTLRELESVRGAFGLPIERDLYFPPTTLADVRKQYGRI
jgi:hypothetical protein